MIQLKNPDQIKIMREAGRITGEALLVARGDGGNTVLSADVGCLSTLTGAGSAQKNQFHVVISSVSD